MATYKKVTDLPVSNNMTANSLIYIVNDPSGTPTSAKITLKSVLEANAAASPSFQGVISGNSFLTTYRSTPANATAVPVGFSVGTMWSDNNYIYLVVGASALKRVAVSTW